MLLIFKQFQRTYILYWLSCVFGFVLPVTLYWVIRMRYDLEPGVNTTDIEDVIFYTLEQLLIGAFITSPLLSSRSGIKVIIWPLIGFIVVTIPCRMFLEGYCVTSWIFFYIFNATLIILLLRKYICFEKHFQGFVIGLVASYRNVFELLSLVPNTQIKILTKMFNSDQVSWVFFIVLLILWIFQLKRTDQKILSSDQ